MVKYKVDILKKLKECGYNTSRIRNEKILSESTLSRIRKGNTNISCETAGRICALLKCQLSDILEITE